MRKLYLSIIALLFVFAGYSQAINTYIFTPVSGTFTPLSGGTVVPSVQDDDASSGVIPLGFTFTYGGVPYTSVTANSNGWLSFNPSTTTSTADMRNNDMSTTNGGLHPLLAPVWDDLDGGDNFTPTPAATYLTTGTTGNHIFTFEWLNYAPYFVFEPTISFQVKLYEATGVIEFIYRRETGTDDFSSASAGISRSSTDYLSISDFGATPTVSSTSSSDNITTRPATGQIYRFSPPVACTGAPTGGTTNASSSTVCYGQPVTLSLTGATTGVSNMVYQWQYAPIATSTWTDITGANGPSFTFTPSAPFQYRAKLTCNTSSLSDFSTATVVSVSNVPTYAAFPYTQDFESWVNGCSTTDRPGVSWGSSPSTTDDSWRRDDQGASASWTFAGSGMYSPAFSTGAHSARFHTYEASSGHSGQMDLFIDLSTDPTPTKFLKFDYINTSGSDVLKVFLSTDGGLSYTQVGANLGTQSTWGPKQFSINSISANTVIRLQATSDFGVTDIGIDNLSVALGCSGTPSAGTAAANPAAVCYGGSSTISLTGATIGAGITYQWQSSPDGITWTNMAGATNSSVSVNNSVLQYRAVITCANGGGTATSNAVTLTTALPTYATIPYFQGFENWINGCGTTDRPDASWGEIPFTSDSAWRRNDQGASANWTLAGSGGYSPVFTEGSHSARFHTYEASNRTRGIMDLFVNMSTAPGNKLLKFDYINTSGSDSLVIFLSEDAGASFTRLDSLKTRANWFTKQISINSMSPTAVIRFRATSDFGVTDIGMDNLMILTACNAAPAAGTVNVAGNNPSVCAGNSTTLSVSGQTQGPGIGYIWQSSTDNVTFTDISGATSTSVVVTPSANTYYRVRVICNNTNDTTNATSVMITVNNPQVTSTTPVTRCGPGTVPLFATGSAGTTLSWYTTATGGAPVGTGTTFTTPIINTSTTYYVSAGTGGASVSVGAANTSISTSLSSQTTTGFNSAGINFSVLAPTVTISSVTIFPTSAVGSNYTIVVSDGNTVVASYSGQTTVSGTTGSPVAEVVPVNFTLNSGTNYQMYFTTNPGTIRNSGGDAFPYTVPGTISLTSSTLGGFYYYFYNWNVTTGCVSPRVAVQAGISPAPAFDVTTDATICNNSIKTLTVTTGQSSFDTYSWSPATYLYTDAAATTPYVAGASASTVYVKSNVAGTYTYIATANNNSTSCQNIDSLKVTVLPGTVTIDPSTAAICVSGETTLNLNPSTGYGAANIQWYSSTDGGATYTAITGATGVSYTTPTLTATTGYKAEIKDDAGNSCLQPTFTVNVNNPQVLTNTPGARCGPGTVTLNATSSANTTLNWYDAPTGGALVGTGTSFTTPSLNATTNYYVSAFSQSGTGAAGRTTPLPNSSGFNGNNYGLVFSATQPFTITSVDVYPTSTTAGAITVELTTSTGAVLLSAGPFTIPAGTGTTVSGGATPVTLNLGFAVPVGTGYRLRAMSVTGNLIRDNPIGSNFSYPLPIGTVGSITNGLLAGSTSTASYWFFYNIKYATGCESPRIAVEAQVSGNTTITTQPVNKSTCAGSTVTLSVDATGATLSYQWRKNGTPIPGATSANYTITGTTTADAGNYDVVITGLCGTQTSVTVTLTVASSNSWVGTSSNDWNNPDNWCGGVPTSTSDVVITAGTPFQPSLSNVGSVHNLTVNNGASVTIASGGLLNLFGDFVNNGTFTATDGMVSFRGTANQNIAAMNAGTILLNGSGITLTGDMNVGNALILTNGNITLGSNNITLNNTAIGSAVSHIVTNGTGAAISNNIITSSVTIPVGPNATSYNPVIISNGQGRNYTVKVATGINPTINNPARAINRTWDIRPSTAPGSPVNILLQYSDADAGSSATGGVVMEVGVHNGTTWNIVSPANGVTPSGLSDARQVGVATTQFGPIIVANFGGISFPTALAGVDPDVTSIIVMPNPVHSSTILRVNLRRTMKVYWNVVDANGRIVMTFSRQMLTGQTDIPLQVAQLAQGVYQVIGATEKGKTQVVRFVKL